jgi:hypothetical protein
MYCTPRFTLIWSQVVSGITKRCLQGLLPAECTVGRQMTSIVTVLQKEAANEGRYKVVYILYLFFLAPVHSLVCDQ